MEKICKITYYSVLGAFCAFVLYLTAVMFFSPRQDALKRGFIPCTETLVNNLTFCKRGGIGCPLGYLWQDTKCNITVVWKGFREWIGGRQNTPWANYLYTPMAVAETDEQLPYSGNVSDDMVDINNQHDFIEQKHRELENAKIRGLKLNEGVIIADPEVILPDKLIHTENKEIQGMPDDISDEGLIDDMELKPTSVDVVPQKAATSVNVLDKVNKITKEKLENGELKDE